MIKHSEEFKQEAVRIALTSGLSRERVAADLGIGKSTLGKWIAQYRPTDLISAPQTDLARENERLRLENRVLKEERDILKNCPRLSPPVRGRNGSWYRGGRRVAADSLLVA
jgi:transposase